MSFLTRSVVLSIAITVLLLGCSKKEVLDEAAVSLIDAREAVESGDAVKALELLDASIALRPSTWAYLERAKIHEQNDDDEASKADIAAGLEMDPEHSDLLWLQKQLKKSRSSRFKGKSGQAPSVNK